MYSTTGLAVGMAIGFPAFVFIVVFIAFWYRQKLRYKKDIKDHNDAEDYDEVNDLDLDNMIHSPKESHIKDFSSDNLVSGDLKNNKPDGNLTRNNTVFGENGVIIKHGNYSIRKESKIMGLCLVSKDNEDLRKSKIISSNRLASNKMNNINDENNYKLYYESVIPVLPAAALENNGSASSVDKEDVSMNPPKTPMKLNQNNGASSNNTNSRASNNKLYKMLQDDSPFYPRSRITSASIPDSPFSRLSHHNSSASLAEMMKQSQQQAEQLFNSPAHSSTNLGSSENNNPIISPFDTPPAKKHLSERFSSYSINDDDQSSAVNHRNQTFDAGDVKGNSKNMLDQSVNYSDEDDDEDIPRRHADYDDDDDNSLNSADNSALESSPLKDNLHRRVNSAESRIILDGNTNAAEESYNLKRKEWLDMYKKR